MSEETQKSVVQEADEAAAQKNVMDPRAYLDTFTNAPSKATVESWKQQAPNGVVRLFAPGKRVYLVRGIGGLELATIQAGIPENLGASLNPEARQAKIEQEISLAVSSKCVCWTSTTADGKLTVEQLRAGSAGLPSTLFSLVTWLSDFVDPEAFQVMSAEL